MDDEKLKVVIAILGGIVFGLIFVMLAFVLPIKDSQTAIVKKAPKSHLEKISHQLKEKSQ